jgi:hypothetical protein
MRHATWLRLEASPLFSTAYQRYRRLPAGVRAPLRTLLLPHWQMAAYLIRAAARRRVVTGPFRGMRFELSALSGRHLLGYLLGSYERELREVVGRILDRGYGTVINIGAGEGYYAVGFALRSPATRIDAFEALSEYHPLIERSVRLNRVADRITLNGLCDAVSLQCHLRDAAPPTLVFMDIEGGEIDLLNPELISPLQHADILVETHDAFAPGVTEILIDRFSHTHNVECYTAQPRVLSDFPTDFLPLFRHMFPRLAVDLMDERRTGTQRWLFLTVKSESGAAKLDEEGGERGGRELFG